MKRTDRCTKNQAIFFARSSIRLFFSLSLSVKNRPGDEASMQLAIAALHCACLLQSTTDPNQFTHHEVTQFHILNWSAQGKCSEVLTITNVNVQSTAQD